MRKFIEVEIPSDYGGYTPGWWKNHPLAWSNPPYDPDSTTLSDIGFAIDEAVYNDPLLKFGRGINPNDLMMTALSYKGGKGLSGAAQILFRAAIAGLLNVEDPINYPVDANYIITGVNNALNSYDRNTIINFALELDYYNNL